MVTPAAFKFRTVPETRGRSPPHSCGTAVGYRPQELRQMGPAYAGQRFLVVALRCCPRRDALKRCTIAGRGIGAEESVTMTTCAAAVCDAATTEYGANLQQVAKSGVLPRITRSGAHILRIHTVMSRMDFEICCVSSKG